MTDCAGFYAYRPYPTDNVLSRILTRDGRQAIRCLTQFVVEEPQPNAVIAPVIVRTRLSRLWQPGRIVSSRGDPYAWEPGDPKAPTADSAAMLAKARMPVDLEFIDSYIYDMLEDAFMNDTGRVVTPEQILHHVYATHCRTLSWKFRLRYKIGNAARYLIHHAVWKGQDAAMWLLLNLYDVEMKDKKLRGPIHKYKPGEFHRVMEQAGERSHFFGFQSSQKSFLTNLIVLAAGCILLYWKGPRGGLLHAIYRNTALTTAALVFGFLLADWLGPWLLIRVICLLSRLRLAAAFFTRKVHV